MEEGAGFTTAALTATPRITDLNRLYLSLAGALLSACVATPTFAQHNAPVESDASNAAVEAAKEKAAESGGVYEITIWDHVFSQAQADAGKALYVTNCQQCHGPTGRGGPGGPAITGVVLNKKWADTTFLDYYSFARTAMPPSKPGAVGSDQDYVNIVSYILEMHGAEAGDTELVYDEEKLGSIYIVRKPKD